MPGHTGSPYWAAVDFDSDGEENGPPIPNLNQRVYLDPWDNEAYGAPQEEPISSVNDENANSFVGEPVSASFYYVPTKNYDSDDDMSVRRNITTPVEIMTPAIDYSIYGTRRKSRAMPYDIHHELVYYEGPMQDRRRSVYMEEPVYAPHPIIYEPLYGPVMMPPSPAYLPPRSRMSLPHHPEFAPANIKYGKRRKTSRMTDAYEHFAYESLSPDYEDWARPLPKTTPNNFHLSRHGHLQIDYSCSWNSLDRLIRNH